MSDIADPLAALLAVALIQTEVLKSIEKSIADLTTNLSTGMDQLISPDGPLGGIVSTFGG